MNWVFNHGVVGGHDGTAWVTENRIDTEVHEGIPNDLRAEMLSGFSSGGGSSFMIGRHDFLPGRVVFGRMGAKPSRLQQKTMQKR